MIIILCITSLAIYLGYHLYWKRRNFPPGPIPFPLVGNILSLQLPPPGYVALNNWRKKYGDVYTFWLGNSPYISINSYEKLKETFVKDGDTYVGKKEQKFLTDFRGGSYGIVETNGELWRTHRRFALTNLRDFGLGKDLMQDRILIEVEDLFKKFDATAGSEVDIPVEFYTSVANVINQATFGFRFEGEEYETFLKLKKLIDFQNESMKDPKVFLRLFLPFIAKLIPGPNMENMFDEFKTTFFGFFNKNIEIHRNKIDYDEQENNDYCEAYLKEQRKREAEGDFETFSNVQLANTCLDLWFAGLLTTTTTITWSLAYILNTPGIQEKIHEEMDRVIGNDRLITTSDKNDLSYMNAVITESQRCANIFPINLFHETTRDTTIYGYPVKAGTGVVAQVSCVMMDENVFPDPERFNPDRFIDENGKFKKIDEVLPFSIGKRQCLGEGLARMELFLFLANFLNRYKITVKADKMPSIDKTLDSTVTPRDFFGVLEKRWL
ncbi:unnamed protein product [Caenorhabditis angaria]|uniref:CYtochrome P450 family n=1 Tax=Caenorhabditis angaria TaxID=860376 RepID=A0A9P1IWX8_9PELO|nr:unnamed protein product [Caenorhabditis angaria]